MVDGSAWNPGSRRRVEELDDQTELSAAEEVPSDYLSRIEEIQEAVKSKNTLSSDDEEEFMIEIEEDAHRGRATILLNGSTAPSHNRQGDPDRVKKFLEGFIGERTDYSSFERFVEDTKVVLGSEEFEKASLKHPERSFSPQIEDKIEIVAEFLEKYGDEGEYLGKTHYAFVLDDPKRTNSWEVDEKITEYRFVMEGVGVDINRLYASGALGKKGTGSYGPTEISMRKDIVEKYT